METTELSPCVLNGSIELEPCLVFGGVHDVLKSISDENNMYTAQLTDFFSKIYYLQD